MSDSLQPHGLQHARPACPSLSPGICPNWCSLTRWCHPTILCSFALFYFYLHSCPASGSFSVSLLLSSGGQTIGATASTSLLPLSIQGWFPLGWTDLILLSKGFSRVFSSSTAWKHQFFGALPSLWSNCHIHTWLLERQ